MLFLLEAAGAAALLWWFAAWGSEIFTLAVIVGVLIHLI